MTRPYTEPTVSLVQGRQGFSINQLQRRPGQRPVIVDYGATSQEIYLPMFEEATNNDVSTGVGWTWDAASRGDGYVHRLNPLLAADGDYFTALSLFSPQGSIWQLRFTFWIGPDYGKLAVAISSIAYAGNDRLGCPEGKIQDFLSGSFGPALNYITLPGFTQDCYNVTETQTASGMFQVIPGGEPGEVLTDLSDTASPCADTFGADPQSGGTIMDGGPGWYRTKFFVDGKNASSTGYKMRVSRVCWARVDDLFAS